MIAPSSHHRIAEGGETTPRQSRFTDQMIALALPLFAVATGMNVVVVTDGELGRPFSIALGLAVVALALFFWFGIALMNRKPPKPAGDASPEKVSLKDKITEVMNGGRTVLPGVQALLGFQLAAYLAETFKQMDVLDKAVHTASLGLLTLAMIVLMAPPSFHRIAERGEDSARVDRMAVACLLWGLAALAVAGRRLLRRSRSCFQESGRGRHRIRRRHAPGPPRLVRLSPPAVPSGVNSFVDDDRFVNLLPTGRH